MIDWERVAELRGEIGEEDFNEVAEMFLMEVEETLTRLDDALSDPQRLRELLHFLKGSALNLGFQGVSDLCSEGESSVAAGSTSISSEDLRALYTDSRKTFEAECVKRFAA